MSPAARERYTDDARFKRELCDIGRRLWLRGYVDGNGGNISCRLGKNQVLCSPTGISKGFMRPTDLCLVNLDGRQLAGARRMTSEILLHLEIYKNVPQARAVVHSHPPYATAFAVAGLTPPPALTPEFSIFVDEVALCPYETPGSPKFAAAIRPFVRRHSTLLLQNHGVVAWGASLEDAYFKIEILESYCQMIGAARALGLKLRPIPTRKTTELQRLKIKFNQSCS